MGCGCYEDSLHYLVCPKIPKKDELIRGLTGIKFWLKRHNTDPSLTSVLMRILRKNLNREMGDLDGWNFDKESNKNDLKKLVREQRAIGWTSLFKGRMCTMWKEIQGKYISHGIEEEQQPAYKTAEWWTAGVIQQLIYFSLNTW